MLVHSLAWVQFAPVMRQKHLSSCGFLPWELSNIKTIENQNYRTSKHTENQNHRTSKRIEHQNYRKSKYIEHQNYIEIPTESTSPHPNSIKPHRVISLSLNLHLIHYSSIYSIMTMPTMSQHPIKLKDNAWAEKRIQAPFKTTGNKTPINL